jgi:hypothetical protein
VQLDGDAVIFHTLAHVELFENQIELGRQAGFLRVELRLAREPQYTVLGIMLSPEDTREKRSKQFTVNSCQFLVVGSWYLVLGAWDTALGTDHPQ